MWARHIKYRQNGRLPGPRQSILYRKSVLYYGFECESRIKHKYTEESFSKRMLFKYDVV